MKTLIFATLLLLITGMGCNNSRASAKASPPTDILQNLVDALNSKDLVTMTKFFAENATDDRPAKDRAERGLGLAEQGAPFKIEGKTKRTPDGVSGILIDQHGMRLECTLNLTEGQNPKIKSLMVRPARSEEAKEPLSNWTNLQGLANQIVAKRHLPAVGITLVRDGKSESVTAGVREAEAQDKVTVDEPWSIGSIGKPLCSTLIGLLIEEGKLRFDETLGEALKDFPMREEYKPVTLQQIMMHRGGIPQDLGFTKEKVDKIVGSAKTPTAMRENYARDILSRPMTGKPGEKNAYSNAGYALLGVVAERATGKPYESLLKERIFRPLGLSHSFTGSDSLPKDRPTGHIRGPQGGLEPVDMAGPLEFLVAPAGGGMRMSTSDLAKFGQEHLKGLRGQDGLLKAATVARLHEGMKEGSGSFLYACGWGIESNPGIETFHGHNGSNGTMSAQLAIFPKANLVLVSIVNCGGEDEPSPPLEAVLAVAGKYAKQ